jgi:aspartate/methionine/tyrosine aminotransferase
MWPGYGEILDVVELRPFRIERFYAQYEHSTRFMLSSSDCESRTIAELLELEPDAHEQLLECWCGYTESPGGPALRQAIASLYERTGAAEVVVTSCAEEGIFLLYHALLQAGDHVIVETPCYESALEVARSTGAEVSQWRRRYEDGWAHDLDALAGMIRPATRLLYLNQPHNPTGTLMARPTFEHVIELARAHGLVVFSDEVYRELEHDPADRLPAACDLYERAVSLGSISKSYGLPGLRIGWIATRDSDLRDAISTLKDYTTICASAPSEFLAALALRNRHVLLDRNLGIVRRNLPLLDGFFERHAEAFAWIRPTASPIGFPRVTGIHDLTRYCAQLAEAGVLLLPGSVYDQPDHFRIGFGRANMPDALRLLEANLKNGRPAKCSSE